jgi:hypothetical protein
VGNLLSIMDRLVDEGGLVDRHGVRMLRQEHQEAITRKAP